MVDWQNKNTMKLDELHELFKWTLKGFHRVGCNLDRIRSKTVQLISYKAFNSADSDGSNTLDLAELKNWIELNQIFTNFCD